VYLPGILAVSFLWGIALGLTTALASVVAFDLFLTGPMWSLRPATGEFLATLLIFLAVALPTGVVFVLSRRVRAASQGEQIADTARPSYDRLRRIADEQAALRNLATLVAHGAPPPEVFGAVARELANVLGTSHTVIARYLQDGDSVVLSGTSNYEKIVPAGTRWDLEKGTVCELVYRTRAPGRVGGYEDNGVLTSRLRDGGVRSSVGCPIMVGRELWGVAIASSNTEEPLPADTEERMLNFTELAAIAIVNAQTHSDLIASRTRRRHRHRRDPPPDRARPPPRNAAEPGLDRTRDPRAQVPHTAGAGSGQAPAVRYRAGRGRRGHGAAGDLARAAPGARRQGRPEAGAEPPRAPIRRAGRTRRARGVPVAGTARGDRLLHRL
jgi:K+-sensing histidine kinase KdpD